MALFGNFDFGKGLKKQAEAFSRSPVSVRGRKQPAMNKALDDYASKFLATVITHSSQVNPGQLRTGAEVLIEVAGVLHEPAPAYRVFAELASRSRKVPAVPQLGQLVDRLLEQPTDQTKERAALLTYRIVTGTLGSERFIEYLKERAHLTTQTTDWKEYALGIARLIRDGVVQGNDELVNETLQDLVNNKPQLGDQAVPIQQMLAESMMQRRNHRQAEFILVEAAISGADLPDSFYETVDALLAARPETCWELHQLVITRALKRFEAAEMDWPNVLQKLAAAKLHEVPLLTFLLEHPLTLQDSHLEAYVRQNLQNLPEEARAPLVARYEQLTGGRTLAAPAQQQVRGETVPPVPTLGRASAEPEQIENLGSVAIGDTGSLRGMLRENVKPETIDMMSARALLRQLSNAGLPEWAPLEARLWLVEQLVGLSKERLAVQLLDDLLQQSTPRETQLMRDRLQGEQIGGLAARLRKSIGSRDNSEIWLRLVRVALSIGEFRAAKELLIEIAPDTDARRQAFAELEHWITRQTQPTPWMLITLSEARRDSSDDPRAGFDVATQAALLAPHDANVQRAYSAWTGKLPAEVVHERRLSQGIYLLTREERVELLPVVLGELESAHSNGIDVAEWIDQLVPVVGRLRGASRTKARESLLQLVAKADAASFQATFETLTSDLEENDKFALVKRISDADPVAREHLATIRERLETVAEETARAKVESEIETARAAARPVRYSAGEMVPGEPVAQRPGAGLTSPWRRALAIARRKRVAGDLDGAIRDLQAALELDPKEAELSIELAETFADRHDYAIARSILGETLESLGGEGNVELRLRSLYCLATVIEHLENPAEAMHCLEELLIIRHDYRDSRERLETLKEQMRPREAVAAAPSNIAANVILEGILDLLNSRAGEGAEVSD